MLYETSMYQAVKAKLPKQLGANLPRHTGCFSWVSSITDYLILQIDKNNINLSIDNAKKYISYINQWFEKYFSLKDIVQIKEDFCETPKEYITKVKDLDAKSILFYLIKSKIIQNFFLDEIFEFNDQAINYYGITNAKIVKSCKVKSVYTEGGNIVNGTITIISTHLGYSQHIGYTTSIKLDVLQHKETGKSFTDFFSANKRINDFVKECGDQTLVETGLLKPYLTDAIIIDYTKTTDKSLVMNFYNKKRLRLSLLTIIRPLLTTKYKDIPIKLIHLKTIFPEKDLFYLYGLINFSWDYYSYFWLGINSNQAFPTDVGLANIFKNRKSNQTDCGNIHSFFNRPLDHKSFSKKVEKITIIRRELEKNYGLANPGNIVLTKKITLLWQKLIRIYSLVTTYPGISLQAISVIGTNFLTKDKIYTTYTDCGKNDHVQIVADDYVQRTYNKNRFKIITQNS